MQGWLESFRGQDRKLASGLPVGKDFPGIFFFFFDIKKVPQGKESLILDGVELVSFFTGRVGPVPPPCCLMKSGVLWMSTMGKESLLYEECVCNKLKVEIYKLLRSQLICSRIPLTAGCVGTSIYEPGGKV